ncbi:hypothetical protein EGW08_006364 [Elysia chlorotica]|uniref:Pre-mRNA-processing factor 19 n=1 Tax=Elysia chlorotica TaxID=188477 RepID=A0A3S0ZU34_ELYCH|nr:hypothetical protein EGW08_006364 [Elysia chlorotica]
MALCCAISNEVPETPVISPVSGHIFEKRLIEKYIHDNGTDPIANEKLSVDQLIPVKSSALVKPRPPSATSIPAILKSLQDEWDAVMLHCFTLRQQLQTARQELSHALYQHDAACRVIARLIKEVTAAREALATLKPQAGMAAPGYNAPAPHPAVAAEANPEAAIQPTEEAVMSEEVIKKLQDKATLLTAERKKRGKTVPEGLATSEDIRSYRQLASHTGLHSASVPGILSVDVCLRDTSKIVTGGNDKNAVVFNKDTEQVMAILKGHTKKVTSVIYHPEEELVISASPDHTIRVWGITTASCGQIIRAHDAPVTGISLHATGDYLLSCSTDMVSGQIRHRPQGREYVNFHFSSFFFFFKSNWLCFVYSWFLLNKMKMRLAFKNLCYYLATSAEDSVVKLWDLRKLKNFKTLQLEDGYEVKGLCFDQSGTYLAVAGSDVRVYLCKQWSELAVFNDHTAAATGVCFGQNSSFLASVSMDRSVKFFGPTD